MSKQEFTTDELAKLPKWAQREFQNLQTLNERLQALLAQNNEKNSPVRLPGSGIREAPDLNLDAKYGVDFHLGADGETHTVINARVVNGRLRLMGRGYPSSLVVSPEVSNVIRVWGQI